MPAYRGPASPWSSDSSSPQNDPSPASSPSGTLSDPSDIQCADLLPAPQVWVSGDLLVSPRPVHASKVDPISHRASCPKPREIGRKVHKHYCVHEGKKCPQKASFRNRKATYIEHLNSACGLYRYNCKYCGAGFNRTYNLRRHMTSCRIYGARLARRTQTEPLELEKQLTDLTLLK